MTKRTFDQYCPIARALEIVGQRWSLLIVRELVLGPKRYTDLRRALPGMWTNLLAERLRELEEVGVIRRSELPPPAARTVYELTDRGRELQDVLLALGRWGIDLLPRRRGDGAPTSSAVLVGLWAFFQADASSEIDEVYGLEIGEENLTAIVRRGRLELLPGTASAPAAVLRAHPSALLDLRLGRLDLAKAIATARVSFQGKKAAVARLRRVFALT
jgi:DNA-binding HxlR family transcriptional regulator